MNHPINWVFKKFHELSAIELYEILKLRSRVFVVEQQCIFLDMDDIDQKGHHLSGYVAGHLVAYTRILGSGVSYPEYPSIGRVVTAPEARGKGYGIKLMNESLSRLEQLYGKGPVKIGAQLYLKKFYESLGFTQAGDMYLEDGIEHIPMLRK
jgi:ElaA protein